MSASQATHVVPSAPLRNRLRARLDAPANEVWALVGDLSRFPEYSQGLNRVDAMVDASGACTGYVCYFKPMQEGAEGIVHQERMSWFERQHGWASIADEDNPFGLIDSLTLVTLEPSDGGTALTWDQHYDAQDLQMMRVVFDRALDDMGANLVRIFGGDVVEHFVDG
jgi:Polyketide cyclase / dehydrase and lipid transport